MSIGVLVDSCRLLRPLMVRVVEQKRLDAALLALELKRKSVQILRKRL